jgi:hypothetical protein
MPTNVQVVKAVQLLTNARARREAVNRMDQQDFDVARDAISFALADTRVKFSSMPSPELAAEIDDLRELSDSMKSRENDALSRKRMSYRRETLRKSK